VLGLWFDVEKGIYAALEWEDRHSSSQACWSKLFSMMSDRRCSHKWAICEWSLSDHLVKQVWWWRVGFESSLRNTSIWEDDALSAVAQHHQGVHGFVSHLSREHQNIT
jgi:hypothetical protein